MQQLPITYLFVPGSRPDRFEKALSAGADRVIIDLEDAVAPDEKTDARQAVVIALESGLSAPVHVRVNPLDSAWFDDDIDALLSLSKQGTALSGIVIPKAESPNALRHVCATISNELEIIAMIETARGVKLAEEIIALPKISKLALGAVDLSVDLDSSAQSAVIDFAYAQIVFASRLAQKLPPIGSPPLSITDLGGVEAEAHRLRGMGLSGQLCIHPNQIPAIHAGFLPSAADIDWAQQVLDSVGGSVQVDGQMVDKPVRDKAERILARAEGMRS